MENSQSLLPKTSQQDSFWQYPWLRKTIGDFYKDLKLLAILELVYSRQNHLSFKCFILPLSLLGAFVEKVCECQPARFTRSIKGKKIYWRAKSNEPNLATLKSWQAI